MGDNVYWSWTVTEFLNRYTQIHDNDYIFIVNGVGTPTNNIVLNKKGITISGQNSVVFDAKGGNVHFEVTGDNVLIEKLTFRNFNFTGNGGAILWTGRHGILKNCNFIKNTATGGGSVRWEGANGILSDCTFTDNSVTNNDGGAINWGGVGSNATITNCNFINNTANIGGAGVNIFNNAINSILTNCTFTGNFANNSNGAGIQWAGPNGIISDSNFNKNSANLGGSIIIANAGANTHISNCNFINNSATLDGGAVRWHGPNGVLTSCTFINNHATSHGGAISWTGLNGNLIYSIFTDNTVTGNGGAASWSGPNGIVTDSIFTGNTATGVGGALDLWGNNCTVTRSTFTGNTAIDSGGAIWWYVAGSMANCSFINCKSQSSNGIYARQNLNINNGIGIVYVFANDVLSGTSIVVLNNETYYYPPSTNINLADKFKNKRSRQR